MILLIDNYDSFTYNLYQIVAGLGAHITVQRNDELTLEEVQGLSPSGIIVSPGPGTPEEAGVSGQVLRAFAGQVPVLGVCLGHQCLGAAFGARVVKGHMPMHGKTSLVYHRGQGVFRGLSVPFEAVRYHSLVVDPTSLPSELEVTAWTADGTIMGLRHRATGAEGVQFHPESVLTCEGTALLANFVATAGS